MGRIEAREIRGIYVPMATPFDAVQSVDLTALKETIRELNGSGLAGYTMLGSTGELRSVSDREACEIVACAAEQKAEGMQIFAGIGKESVKETVQTANRLARAGADAVLVLTPYYFPGQMTEERLERYYEEAADDSPVPVIIYHAPPYAAGVQVSPGLFGRLALHENIAGIKNTSARPEAEYLARVRETGACAVLAGTDANFWAAVKAGAAGGILAGANYLPELYVKLYRDLKEGAEEPASKLYRFLLKLWSRAAEPYGVAGIKTVMMLLGKRGGLPRRPLLPLTREETKEVRREICACFAEAEEEGLVLPEKIKTRLRHLADQ